MRTDTAMEIVNEQVSFMPGWAFTAKDHSARFQNSILVTASFSAFPSDRDSAKVQDMSPTQWIRQFRIDVDWVIMLDDVKDVSDLLFALATRIIDTFTHETREFLQLQPTHWAPFHPHNTEGQKRWAAYTGNPASPALDRTYGSA